MSANTNKSNLVSPHEQGKKLWCSFTVYLNIVIIPHNLGEYAANHL